MSEFTNVSVTNGPPRTSKLKQVGFEGWDEMLIVSPTLMNQVHGTVWKHKYKLKNPLWKSVQGHDFSIQGTQSKPGKLFTDSNPILRADNVIWYTVTLASGEVKAGNKSVTINEWNIRFLVTLEKYQLSGEEKDLVMRDHLKDLIPWGINLKFQTDTSEETEGPPTFAPGETQDPSPKDAARQLGMTESELTAQVAAWFDHGRTYAPKMACPLGIILRLVPANKAKDEQYHFGPTGFDMFLDNTRHNGYLALSIVTQNHPLPNEPVGWSYDLTPDDYTAKLFVSDQLFWQEWFLPKYKQVVFDTQVSEKKDDLGWDVGKNPKHPDENSSDYDMAYRPYLHSYLWDTWLHWGEKDDPGGYSGHTIDLGDMNKKWTKATVTYKGAVDYWFDSFSWTWTASMWLEMRTDEEKEGEGGEVNVTFGDAKWVDKLPCIETTSNGEKLYYDLKSRAKPAITKATGSLSSFQLHTFYAPGYENFVAQDPGFIPGFRDSINTNGADLTVDLKMNGIPH